LATVVEDARQEVAAARRPWYQTKKWGSVLLIIYAALLVVFGLLAWWVASHPVLAIDIKITRAFQDIQAPWLQMIMIAVSYLGNQLLLFIGLIALTAVLFWIVGLRLEAITVVVFKRHVFSIENAKRKASFFEERGNERKQVW